MRIKSYFAESVQEAIERARQELGPDAMLMNSKKTELELRSLGAYEVIFGVASEMAGRMGPTVPRPGGALTSSGVSATSVFDQSAVSGKVTDRAGNASAGKSNSIRINKGLAALLQPVTPLELKAAIAPEPKAIAPATDGQATDGQATDVQAADLQVGDMRAGDTTGSEWSRELADLRQQIESVRKSLRSQNSASAGSAQHGRSQQDLASTQVADETRERLISQGFSASLASEIAVAVSKRAAAGAVTPTGGNADLLRSELERRFAVAPGLFPAGVAEAALPRAILFAGPAGAGKTTSLIKLAMRYGFAAGAPLQLLSLDTLRVGGWEQLAAYARITGLPFDVVHDPAALEQTLAGYRGKKLILVDTPGLSPVEWHGLNLTVWAAHTSTFEVQLVLPAVLRLRAAARALTQFSAWRPSKLLLTHLDEVDEPGAPLELAMRSGLPISYLANGQQIPEDIQEASKARLLDVFGTATRHLNQHLDQSVGQPADQSAAENGQQVATAA